MPNFRIHIEDEVTYRRRQIVEVEAPDEITACERVHDMAIEGEGSFHDRWCEEQIDAEDYAMNVATPEDESYCK